MEDRQWWARKEAGRQSRGCHKPGGGRGTSAGGEEHGEGTATSHILDQVLAGLAGPRLWGEDAAVTATCREVVGGALGSGRKRGHSLEGPREQV